jgi:hypothetical protein
MELIQLGFIDRFIIKAIGMYFIVRQMVRDINKAKTGEELEVIIYRGMLFLGLVPFL